MGKVLKNLQMDEVSLVKKGFKPKNPEATIEFFKAYPEETTSDSSEGGFFRKVRKAFERITKGTVSDKVNQDRPHREVNEALWAMSDALSDIRYGWGTSYGMTDDQKRQAMHDVIDEGAKLMHESVDKIGQSDVEKAMDTTSGANYEKKDISTNSPGKGKKSKDDPDDDGDIDDSDPALDTDHDKGKGKVKKAMNEEQIKKAVEDALGGVSETIKKAVEDATKPHQEAIAKAQDELKSTVEKATTDISGLVETAKQDIAKAVDDAKIEMGRLGVQKSTEEKPAAAIKSDTSYGDAIRTLMNN